MGSKSKPAKDPRGQHVRLYMDVLTSPAWLALSFTERSLYLAMRKQLNSFNNGTITATPTVLAADGFSSSSTLHKSLRALIAVGLVECVFKGRMTMGGKEASLFRFTDEECYDNLKLGTKASKPTNEWKRWKSVAEAAAAIATAHDQALRPNHPNSKAARGASKVRIPNRKGSEIESEGPFSDSDSERCETFPIRTSNDGSAGEIGRKPAPMLASVPVDAIFSASSHRSNFEHQCITATPLAAAGHLSPARSQPTFTLTERN